MIRYCIMMSFNTINALTRSQKEYRNNPVMNEVKYFYILATVKIVLARETK